jgi:hypothetical protein
MPPVAVDHCRRDLVASVRSSLDFIHGLPDFGRTDASGTFRRLSVRTTEDLAAMSLLKVTLAWEAFTEDAFVRYMCGARSASGFAPTLLNVRSRSMALALAQLLAGRDFLNWSTWNTEARANANFDQGEPFTTALGFVRGTLAEMAVVRNRVAHPSDYAADEFRKVVRARLGHVPRGMTPGRFLLTTSPGPGAAHVSIIEEYGLRLMAASALIVP